LLPGPPTTRRQSFCSEKQKSLYRASHSFSAYFCPYIKYY
jgi:hypothetical protein